nr:MAG TPA: hypothetical protein [Bacteriophage sp.]
MLSAPNPIRMPPTRCFQRLLVLSHVIILFIAIKLLN